jgi:hypothetical protein
MLIFLLKNYMCNSIFYKNKYNNAININMPNILVKMYKFL